MLHRPGAARGHQRNGQPPPRLGQLFKVIAAPHPVLIDAVQHDLAGAEALRLDDPVHGQLAGAASGVRIAGVFVDPPFAVLKGAVDADDDALSPQPLRHLADQLRPFQGGRVDRHLVRPVIQTARRLLHRADAAGDAERDVQQPGDVLHPAIVQRPPLRARGDVVEDQFVGALIAIARGQFGGVAHVHVALEAHALDHPPVLDVEAGDDASSGHWPKPGPCSRPRWPQPQ